MRSPFYKYANLVKNETSYARRMNKLGCRIFGDPPPNLTSKAMKVVKILSIEPFDKCPYRVHWYPRHVETAKLTSNLRDYGLFRDEHQDFRDEMNRLEDLRGKNWMKNWKIKLGKLKE